MAWTNQAITVYHGTDNLSATSIRLYGIDPRKFRARTDFGAGFYVTSVLHQAEQWANRRCRRRGISSTAEVLQYEVSRDTVERLRHLTFIVDDSAYHDFVDFCRSGAANHGPLPRTAPYEVVHGLVSLWPQRLVLASCDQILFSDPRALTDFDNPTRSLSPPLGRRFF